ncbi:MAG TPA: deoxyguanosinetriphosphate triphosphohydrolase [Gammaproteobacteria bacterium]|jgi:dGTPase|nr:deoxyguanosinetriphosphate triphosphohydrolase [Gammaproteobacteria bacterium]
MATKTLAIYAARSETSRGRKYPETPPTYRTEYDRDRDRIIHSSAFRRLMYKTQVFVYDEGDHYRTRLTHSLEVAQIARSVARVLDLNEPLTEAIALAHDLGHTPFGHAGQDALNEAMKDYGGFEHNLQSLRVVDLLEERYAEFPGLNLTFEAREGILKHCSLKNVRTLGELGERFINRTQPSLEAQLVDVADAIAYNNHDVDDGLRSGLLTVDELKETTLFREHCEDVRHRYPGLPLRRLAHETVRRMMNALITDLIQESRQRLEAAAPENIEAVRKAGKVLIGFSEPMAEKTSELHRFLYKHLYEHEHVRQMTDNARQMVQSLFKAYFEDPSRLPQESAERVKQEEQEKGESGRARIVADYIAGMTDRYATKEHQRTT